MRFAMGKGIMRLNIALLGAGFIGKIHAENLAQNPSVGFAGIYDLDEASARAMAEQHGVPLLGSLEGALNDDSIDAVFITTPPATHPTLILQAAQAGKAVFCEKPVGTNLDEVDALLQSLADIDRPVQIGFNRRFDSHHRALADRLKGGAIGRLEQVTITSRDPHPPPVAYMRNTPGGIFYDSMIHDFDMARWLLDEEPIEVYAVASSLIGEELNPDRDLDTAMATLRTASGKMCSIQMSRRAVYGYDQRIEVFGEKGMLQSGNVQVHNVRHYGAKIIGEEVLLNFFTDRYRQSYVQELESFLLAVLHDHPVEVTIWDGRQSLALSLAALRSATEGVPVQLTHPHAPRQTHRDRLQ